MRIGVLGGSFNPVHEGHLALAEAAREELGLDRVLFVPTHVSPLKNPGNLLPLRRRLSRLRRALSSKKGFRLELCEVRRGGISYTVDTLRHLRRKWGKKAVLYFICGADTPRKLSRWKSPREVLELCRFAVANRPGYPRPRIRPGMIGFDMTPVALSSSDIRRRGRLGGFSSKRRKK